MADRTTIPHAGSRRRGLKRLRRLLALWRPALNLALATGFLATTEGCTRPFYRKRADDEVTEVLGQKDKYPAWAIENWHVYADPRARFADPCDPDHPPKPPDDPAAYDLSPNPQNPGKAGIARLEGAGYLDIIAGWDRENRARLAREEEEEKKKTGTAPAAEKKAARAKPNVEATFTRAADGMVTIHLKPRLQKVQQVAAVTQPAARNPSAPGEGAAAEQAAAEDTAEEASARSSVDITGQRAFLLTLDQAAELAMFNSREYQDQRENLYLAALPVTQQRFSFMGQLFAAEQAIRNSAGSGTPGGKANNWTLNTGVGAAKVLPTGALLLLNFANRTVFDFLNPKRTLSVSTLNFDAIQPLLRGGGKAVALEALTQAERNLLYQIRDYARFRKSLYVLIASSNGGSIAGGSFQPSGVLSGNNFNPAGGIGGSGLTPGVIPAVSTTLTGVPLAPGTAGNLGGALSPAITPAPAGYLNTMLQKIQVYIDEENIAVLTVILQRFRGLLEGDVVQPLQVQSVEQQLFTGRSTLLMDQSQYLQALDSFKLELGLPMTLNIEPEESVLRPLINQFRRSRAIIEQEQTSLAEASRFGAAELAPQVRTELLRLFEQSTLSRGTRFARGIRSRVTAWTRLSDAELEGRLRALRQELQKLLDLQADQQKKNQKLSPADRARLSEVESQLDLGGFERVLRLYEAAYVEGGKAKKPATPAAERLRITRFQSVLSYWQRILVEARNEQRAVVRGNWPALPRCCVDGVDLIKADLTTAQLTSSRYAVENRFDLMNVRAQVVDAWRQVRVFANALLGVFNVEYHLTANSPLTVAKPLAIGGSGTAHQLVLNTALPLVRVIERNNYRAALIGYQRQRRALQEGEDLAALAVRGQLSRLRQLAETYTIQQRQLDLAYLTIDNALEALVAPTAPGRNAPDGPAALTQQLLSAQRSLPQAQNALLTVWVNYLNARLQLYRDLELMPLDARGVWIDEVRDEDCGCTPPGKQPAAALRPPTPAGGEKRELPEPIPAPRAKPTVPDKR